MVNNERRDVKVSLESEFTDIVRSINMEGGVIAEKATDTRQYKYRIDDAQAYKARLAHLGAVMAPEGLVEQTDYYFLYPGEKPHIDSDTLCWREEKGFVNYHETVPKDAPELGRLIIKTNPLGDDPHPSRLVRYATIEDEESQCRVLEKIHAIRNGSDFAPYRVSKKKTTYLLPIQNGDPVIIDLDEQVELSNDAGTASPYYVGDFLKMKIPKDSSYLADTLRELLGVTGDAFDVPYIAQEAFVRRLHTSRPNSLSIDDSGMEHLWVGSLHRPYYYDAAQNKFMVGLDVSKLKGFDAHEKKQVQDEIEAICADLDASQGGENLPSRSGGNGGGSTTYERLTDHDGFIKHPSIRAAFESATLWRKRWQPADRRIVFSRVTFKGKSARTGILVHFVGSHEEYERWLRQHRNV